MAEKSRAPQARADDLDDGAALAALLDPIALEKRLRVARAQRAEALAARPLEPGTGPERGMREAAAAFRPNREAADETQPLASSVPDRPTPFGGAVVPSARPVPEPSRSDATPASRQPAAPRAHALAPRLQPHGPALNLTPAAAPAAAPLQPPRPIRRPPPLVAESRAAAPARRRAPVALALAFMTGAAATLAGVLVVLPRFVADPAPESAAAPEPGAAVAVEHPPAAPAPAAPDAAVAPPAAMPPASATLAPDAAAGTGAATESPESAAALFPPAGIEIGLAPAMRPSPRPLASGPRVEAVEQTEAPASDQPPAPAETVLAVPAPEPAPEPTSEPADAPEPDGPASFAAPAAPLAETAATPIQARIMLHAPTGVPAATTDAAAAAISRVSGQPAAAPIPVRFAISRSNVRYYHPEDAAAAEAAAAALSAAVGPVEARDFTSYSPKPSPGTVEVWLSGEPGRSGVARPAPAATTPAPTPTGAAPDPAGAAPPAPAAPAGHDIRSLVQSVVNQPPPPPPAEVAPQAPPQTGLRLESAITDAIRRLYNER